METRLAQPLAPMPDWAALTIRGMRARVHGRDAVLILSPSSNVAGGAGVVAVLLGFGVDVLGRRRRPTRSIRTRNTSRCSSSRCPHSRFKHRAIRQHQPDLGIVALPIGAPSRRQAPAGPRIGDCSIGIGSPRSRFMRSQTASRGH